MKSFLERDFKSHYKVGRAVVVSTIAISDVAVALDSVGENIAIANSPEQGVLKLSNTHGRMLTIVEHEKFIKTLAGLDVGKGKVCDCIIYYPNGVIFSEFTRSQSQYVEPYVNSKGRQEGKRAFVEKQIKESIDRLLPVPSIARYVAACNQKIALFAVRLTAVVDSADSAEMAMSTFLRTTAIIKNISVENWYENFTFEQRIYPELFEIL